MHTSRRAVLARSFALAANASAEHRHEEDLLPLKTAELRSLLVQHCQKHGC